MLLPDWQEMHIDQRMRFCGHRTMMTDGHWISRGHRTCLDAIRHVLLPQVMSGGHCADPEARHLLQPQYMSCGHKTGLVPTSCCNRARCIDPQKSTQKIHTGTYQHVISLNTENAMRDTLNQSFPSERPQEMQLTQSALQHTDRYH